MMQTAESLFDRSTEATEEQLSRIFKKSLQAVNDAWVPGVMAFLNLHKKELMANIAKAEDSLERTWKLVVGGYLNISDFEEAASIWRDAHILGIETFRRAAK